MIKIPLLSGEKMKCEDCGEFVEVTSSGLDFNEKNIYLRKNGDTWNVRCKKCEDAYRRQRHLPARQR